MNHPGNIPYSKVIQLYNRACVYVYDVFEFLGKQLPIVDKHDLFVDE
jgi:hypothetical protein